MGVQSQAHTTATWSQNLHKNIRQAARTLLSPLRRLVGRVSSEMQQTVVVQTKPDCHLIIDIICELGLIRVGNNCLVSWPYITCQDNYSKQIVGHKSWQMCLQLALIFITLPCVKLLRHVGRLNFDKKKRKIKSWFAKFANRVAIFWQTTSTVTDIVKLDKKLIRHDNFCHLFLMHNKHPSCHDVNKRSNNLNQL